MVGAALAGRQRKRAVRKRSAEGVQGYQAEVGTAGGLMHGSISSLTFLAFSLQGQNSPQIPTLPAGLPGTEKAETRAGSSGIWVPSAIP